jgi:hypothetical protein
MKYICKGGGNSLPSAPCMATVSNDNAAKLWLLSTDGSSATCKNLPICNQCGFELMNTIYQAPGYPDDAQALTHWMQFSDGKNLSLWNLSALSQKNIPAITVGLHPLLTAFERRTSALIDFNLA